MFRAIALAVALLTATPAAANTLNADDPAPISELAQQGMSLSAEIARVTEPMLARGQIGSEFQCLEHFRWTLTIVANELSSVAGLMTLSAAMIEPRDEQYVLILARAGAQGTLQLLSHYRDSTNQYIGTCPNTPAVAEAGRRTVRLLIVSYDQLLPLARRIGVN